MPIRAREPELPPELRGVCGEPEHAFGPNVRFHTASVLMGTLLLAIGVGLFVLMIGLRNGRPGAGGFDGMLVYVVGGLLAMGGGTVYYALWMPANWLFVCPNGLIRRLNGEWEALPWAAVARFQDLGATSGVASVRQCRIVTTDGREWGFMADWYADYGRLKRVLRERIVDRPAGPEHWQFADDGAAAEDLPREGRSREVVRDNRRASGGDRAAWVRGRLEIGLVGGRASSLPCPHERTEALPE